ncbi:MAG: extracellular solute-binding protein [Bifidobacteriaceae bacterium]|jgi:arabinogalactan oligomer/maltooligosaccharide transport system substrate-binding protein|nr:extracellular solute-binding protein [Bifidobacteriaceae bacterium]
MKRLAAVAAVAIGLTVGLAACGGGQKDDGKSNGDSGKSSVTLTVWVDETRINALKPIVGEYEKSAGVTIKLEQKNFDDIRADFNTQVSAGAGPDIAVGANDWLGELIANNLIAPVDLSTVADQLDERAVAAYTSAGQTYGVPYALENIALVRNNAVLSETKATTFDELIAEAKATGTEGSVLLQIGEEGDGYTSYPLQSSFGAPVFKQDADGEWTPELGMTGDPGHAYAQYLGKLGAEGVFSKSVTYDIVKADFQAGKAPYAIVGPWLVADWKAAGMDVTVLPVPSAGGQPAQPFLGVPGFFLSAQSKQQAAAQRFMINFLTAKDTQLALFDVGGRLPANTEAAADPKVVEDPIVGGFLEAGKSAVLQPAIPAMNQVWKPWGKAEADIIGGADPVATWDKAMADIQQAITAAG